MRFFGAKESHILVSRGLTVSGEPLSKELEMKMPGYGWLIAALGIALCSVGCGSGASAAPAQTHLAATNHPLVAQYSISEYGPAGIWAEFGPDTNYGRETSVIATTELKTNSVTLQVAGMKASSTYHMRVHVDYANGASWVGQDETFTTGALPSTNHLGLTVTRPNPNLGVTQDGVEMLDLITAPGTNNLEGVVTDLDGNIIWYYDPGVFPFPIKQLSNGHVLYTAGTDMQEVDLAGNIIRHMTLDSLNQKLQAAGFTITPTGLHHDILVLPNGHWIVLGQMSKTYTNLPGYPGDTDVLGDVLIDLDPDWNPVWTWSSFEHLDVNRHMFGLPDWTHSNAVIYTPNDGNIIVSMRNQSWLLKIDYADGAGTGAVLWRLGIDGDFAISPNDPAQWFYGQHYPNLIGTDGSQVTLAIFDDGDLRPDSGGIGCPVTGPYPACYSRAVIVQADEAVKVATVQWQYLPQYYTLWGGSIGILDNGDVEFDGSQPFGSTIGSRILEVTQTDNPQVVWQMDTSGASAYRGFRIPSLYPGVVWH